MEVQVQQRTVSTPQWNTKQGPFSRDSFTEDLKEQDRAKDADPSLRVSTLSKFVIPKRPKDPSDHEIRAQPKTSNKKKPLKCPNCSLSFTLSSNLRRHMRLHRASKNISRCDECGHTFAEGDRLRLARHMKSHSGERPYVCQECEMAFKTSGALRVHLMTHTGEKPLSCTECSARFRHEFSLKIHLMIHTGERPFLCALCDKRFYKKRHLEFHMISHTNVKPAECEECGARFRDNSRLKAHMRRHTGAKAFTCDVCKRKFEIEANCQKHLLTHENERRAKLV